MKPATVAIIQARTGSTRLPGKVLRDIEGATMLERVVSRVKRAKTLDNVIIATTDSDGDAPIVRLCREREWSCFRGDEQDVLDRIYQAAIAFKVKVVVRINADCPLIDAGVIDACVEKFLKFYPDIDYVSNVLPRTYPRGLDTEVINISTLRGEWEGCTELREHVTIGIRNNVENYSIAHVSHWVDCSFMRWTVDTEEDLEFMRKVYRKFTNDKFTWKDVMAVLSDNPEWVIKDTQVDPK